MDTTKPIALSRVQGLIERHVRFAGSVRAREILNNWGVWRRKLVNPINKFAYGSAAFCGSHGIAVVRQREVTLLDPATGQPIWLRRAMPDCS